MELYSLLEMSKRLDVPESTLRRWKNRFEEYLPTIGSGRTTRYKPEALEALRLIRSLAAEDTPWDDIESALQAGFARTVEASSPDVVSPPPAVTALGEMVADATREAMREHLALAREQQAQEHERMMRLLEDRLPPREARRVRWRERLRVMVGR